MHRTMFVLSVMLSLPMLFLVSCQEKEVDWNRRIEEYAAKAATNPSDDNALAMLGEAFYRIEDYDSAIENCAKAIELNQNNVRAFSYRGLSYFYRPDSDYDSAFPDLEKAISLSQKNAEVYYGAAYILNQKEQYKEAIDNYDKSIRLDSKKSEFYRNRGIALSNYGFTEEGKPRRTELLNRAITDFKKAVELNPNFRLNYFVLGVNGYYQNGQYDKAIEALTKAYELDPNHGSTVKYLAYSYSRDILGKSSYSDSESTNAMDWIEKALSISDDDADLYLFRARLYGNAEDFDKAIADYNKALELAPGADFVKNEMEQTRKLQKQKEREAYLAQFPRLTARELTKAYEDNPKGTREKWQRGMTIIISGSVQDFSSFHWAFGEPQPPNVVLDGYNATSLVNCYFPYDGSIENIILHREAVIMGKIYGFGSSMSGNTVVQLHACSVVE